MAMLEEDNESVAEPNDASVTKMLLEFGIRAVPKRTAVPAGLDLTSCVATDPLTTGKTERKPVLLTAGLPFTVVSNAVESALKNVCETVLVGPTGGVLWSMLKARREVSSGVRPLEHIEKQAIPALAPELATHAWESDVESVTLIGNSPRVFAGWPTIVNFVGSVESMLNMEMVFEPGLTATRFWFC